MKDFFITYARYSKRANTSVLELVGGLPLDIRNQAARSYYGSLHQLVAHILGGTLYFLGLFRPALTAQAAVFAPLADCSVPEGDLDKAGFNRLKTDFDTADAAVIRLVREIAPQDLAAPVTIDWYPDRSSVPFHFLFNQLIVHGIHHRGQVSQILDELKVEHDFSGIDLEFMNP